MASLDFVPTLRAMTFRDMTYHFENARIFPIEHVGRQYRNDSDNEGRANTRDSVNPVPTPRSRKTHDDDQAAQSQKE